MRGFVWLALIGLMSTGACRFDRPADVQAIDAAPPVDSPDAGPDFAIGGTVTGLWTGATVALELTAAPDEPVLLTVDASGAFTFDRRLESGRSFTVTVTPTGQPFMHTCLVSNAAGRVEGADVDDVLVTCHVLLALSIDWEAPVAIATFDPDVVVYNGEVATAVQQTRVTVTAPAATTIQVGLLSASSGNPVGPFVLQPDENTVEVFIAAGPISQHYQFVLARTSPLVELDHPPYLKASNTGGADHFGAVVAADGRYLVVGAPFEDSSGTGVNPPAGDDGSADSGAVYVFRRTGFAWVQEAFLKASVNHAGDHFGASVAVNDGIGGVVVAVGAPDDDEVQVASGSVHVFRRTSAGWAFEQRVRWPTPGPLDQFGTSVALTASWLIVGAPGNGATGVAYPFHGSNSVWTADTTIRSPNPGTGDRFGARVAAHEDAGGTVIAVSAPLEDSGGRGVDSGQESDDSAPDSGAVYVFRRGATQWDREAYVKAANSDGGDRFGTGLALDGSLLVVGADGEDSGVPSDPNDESLPDGGAGYVLRRTGGVWAQEAYLKATPIGFARAFGRSVDVRGDLVVCGAADDDLGGSVYLFDHRTATWTPTRLVSANLDERDGFGAGVALSGQGLFASAPDEDGAGVGLATNPGDNSAIESGAVYALY